MVLIWSDDLTRALPGLVTWVPVIIILILRTCRKQYFGDHGIFYQSSRNPLRSRNVQWEWKGILGSHCINLWKRTLLGYKLTSFGLTRIPWLCGIAKIRFIDAERSNLNRGGTIPRAGTPEMKKEKESKLWNKSIHHPLLPSCGGHVTDTS